MHIQKVKDQAFSLVSFLRGEGIRLEHGRSLDAVSSVFYGKADWNTLCASLVETSPSPGPLHQQLMRTAIAQEEEGWKQELANSRGTALSRKVVAVGRLDGTLVSVSCGLAVDELVTTRAVLGGPVLEEMAVVSFSVLLDTEGNVGAGGLSVVDWEAELNRTLVLRRWYNNTACRGTCPLTGEQFKPSIGLQYFLGDSASPVLAELVPERLHWVCTKDFEEEMSAPRRTFSVSVLEILDLNMRRRELTAPVLAEGTIDDQSFEDALKDTPF